VDAGGFVIAATGLRAEARLAERSSGVTAVAGGGLEARLAGLIEHAIGRETSGIISFGIAGALAPGLAPGACIVGSAVVLASGEALSTDAAWTDRLLGAIPGVRPARVFGSSTAIAEADAKAALHRRTQAAAVDMESHVVARIASERRLPFAVLRVIADSADQSLPPAAVNGMKPNGAPDLAAVLKSLARQPGQLPDLLRAAFAARRAMNGLLRCHRLVGPRLGFVDLG